MRQLQYTGVLVRAAHNRSLDQDSECLWTKMEAVPNVWMRPLKGLGGAIALGV